MKKLLTWIFALIVLSSFVFAAADINLTTELWGYWSSDNADLDGSNATDKLNNHNLSITDATTGETGILQECFGYDGTDDYILTSTPDVKKLYDYSLQVWIKCSSGSYPHVGGFGYWVADDFYSHVVGDAGAGVMAYYDAYKINNPTIYSGDVCNSSWVHLLYVVTNSYVAVFVNGELGGNISNTNNWRPKDNNRLDTLLFGGRAKNGVVDEDFSGYIDEMAIWNRTLNYTEAYSLWNGGSGLPYSNFLTTPTTIEFTAQDSVNSSSINDFAINISWVNGTMQEESTSTGTIIISDTIESDTTINVTFWNVTGYMDKTMLNQAINANTTNSITGLMDFIQTTRLYFGISDQWNGSSINDFAVNISWLNGSVETSSTSNGTASMEPEVFANTTVNITFWNMSGYYSQSITDQLLVSNISNVINSTTYQAVACFNATEIISGYWITADNYTIGSNSTTECFNISAGNHTVIAQKEGYYNVTENITVNPLTNLTYTLDDFYNSVANISVYYANGTVVSTWNATLSNDDYSWSYTINVTTGEYLFNTINGSYDIVINDSTGTEYFVFSINGTEDIKLYHFGIDNCSIYNTTMLNFTMLSEGNNSLLNDALLDIYLNVTSEYFVGSKEFNFSFSSGNYYSLCVPSGSISSWTAYAQMEYSKPSLYDEKTYYLTDYPLNETSSNINLYLTQNTSMLSVLVRDYSGQPISSAYVKVLSYDLGTNSYRTTEIIKTDTLGNAYARVKLNTNWYAFIVEYNGQIYLQTLPTKIISSEITLRINLFYDYSSSYDVAYSIVHSLFYNNATDTFNFVFDNPSGNSVQGCLEVIKRSAFSDQEINTTCVNSASGNILISISNETGTATYIGNSYFVINDNTVMLNSTSHSKDETYKEFGELGWILVFLISLSLVMLSLWYPGLALLLCGSGVVFGVMLKFVMVSWTGIVVAAIIVIVAAWRTSHSND